jgi:hypothetical protein
MIDGILLIAALTANVPEQPDYLALCRSSVQATRIWMNSTIGTHRKELVDRLNAVEIPAYCRCYHDMLGKGLGKELYERSRRLDAELSVAEMKAVHAHDLKAVIACVETQLAAVPDSGGAEKYDRFIRSTVSPGEVGGLRLGDARATMFDILGRNNTFRTTPDGGEEYFYGPNVIEVTIAVSPAPGRLVRSIALNRLFRGQVSGGGRIGDPRERIKSTYPGQIAVDVRDLLVYCDGTTFVFQQGRLEAIRMADLETDVFAKDRQARCR